MIPRSVLLVGLLACGVILLSRPAVAEEPPSSGAIECALDPKCAKPPLTRSLRQRGIIIEGAPVEQPLSVNLYVNFAYDSAELTSDARITLDRLGGALRDPRLSEFSFVIAGHTDAKGGDEYNQKLSERRAETVRSYLVAQFGISAARLTAKGYGKSQLLDPARPEDGVNRRVQVINAIAGGKGY
jgi:outer membrane protein OmpA-like peptidoglycan-associated protein